MRDVAFRQVTSRLLELLDGSHESLVEAEVNRHFDSSFIGKVAETGFFRLTRPRQFGGEEIEYEQLLDLVLAVAERSGSLAWCLMIMAQHLISARSYPASAVGELFTSDPLLIATSFYPVGRAEPQEEGFLLSGKWQYVTGIHFANWVIVDAEIAGGQARGVAKFIVPASAFVINDDWRVSGMRATGSNSVTLPPFHVSASMHISGAGRELSSELFARLPRRYRIPHRIMIVLGTVVPMVGMLKGMLADCYSPANRKSGPGSNLEEIALRDHLLRIKSRVEQTEFFFRAIASQVTALTMKAENGFDVRTQYGILANCSEVADSCRAISSELFALVGTKACREDSPIGRRMLDIHVMSTHYLIRRSVIGINSALASLNG